MANLTKEKFHNFFDAKIHQHHRMSNQEIDNCYALLDDLAVGGDNPFLFGSSLTQHFGYTAEQAKDILAAWINLRASQGK